MQYGSAGEAIGKTLAISGVPFTVIGVFRERVETFGQSEIVDETVLIPYTVARYFTGTDAVNQIYFSMTDSGSVLWASQAILKALKSRHRSESVYNVGNLSEVLSMAGKTATAFSIVLLMFSLVTLLVSGVGIMNIMLATVRSRIREIGIRKALGATFREIQLQFLAEAVLISLSGGVVGTVLAMLLPLSIAFFTDYRLQVSWLSAVIAILVSCAVGIAFGTVPAVRAARMDRSRIIEVRVTRATIFSCFRVIFSLHLSHQRYILKERRIRFWFSARSALGVRTTCRYPD